MMRLPFALAAACLALSACGSDPDEAGDHREATGAPEIPEQTGFASTYTDLDLDACELVAAEHEEGSSTDWRCPGFGEIALLVHEGDGRFDVDAGGNDGGFQTIMAFNELGKSIEWRLKGDRPFAVIFRYRDVSMQNPGRTVLAVETVGTENAPGCRVAHVAGDIPDANQRARDLADAASRPGFDCPDQPELVGEAG